MSAATHSPSNATRENDEAGFCVLENCDRSLFLSATKRPFPAAAADKPFCPFVVCSWRRIKVAAPASGLWAPSGGRILDGGSVLRLNGFVSTADYARVHEPTESSFLEHRCFVPLRDNNPASLMGSRVRPLWYRRDIRLGQETDATGERTLLFPRR